MLKLKQITTGDKTT